MSMLACAWPIVVLCVGSKVWLLSNISCSDAIIDILIPTLPRLHHGIPRNHLGRIHILLDPFMLKSWHSSTNLKKSTINQQRNPAS